MCDSHNTQNVVQGRKTKEKVQENVDLVSALCPLICVVLANSIFFSIKPSPRKYVIHRDDCDGNRICKRQQ